MAIHTAQDKEDKQRTGSDISLDTMNASSKLIDPELTADSVGTTIFESAISDVDSPDDNDDVKWMREQRLHHTTLDWFQKPTVLKLCLALFVWFIAFGISLSSKVTLMLQLICNYAQEEYGIETCHDPKVQELTSALQLKTAFLSGLTATILSGKIGELSDRFGRKRILIFMALTTLVGRIINLWLFDPATKYHQSYFLVVSVLDNLGGGMIGMLGVANSYITDIVDPEDRIVSLGFSNGTMFAGLGVGPLLGAGLIYLTKSDFSPLYADVLLSFGFLLIIVFLIQESRSKKLRNRSQSIHLIRKESFASQRSNRILPVHKFYEVFAPLKLLVLPKHKTLGYIPRVNVLLLVFIEAMLMCASASYIQALILYTTYRFNWNSEMIGYFISLSGLFKTLTLYIGGPAFQHLIRKFFDLETKAIDYNDYITIITGSVFELICPVMIIMASSSGFIFLSTFFGSVAAIAIPSLQGTIMKYMKEEKAGEVFGALGLIKNIIIMVGPSSFLLIYSSSVDKVPTLVFYVASTFILAAIILTTFLRIHEPNADLYEDFDVEEEEVRIPVGRGVMLPDTLRRQLTADN